MKSVRLVAMLVAVSCPECDEPIINPATDSYDWAPTDLTTGNRVHCEACGTVSKIGAVVSLSPADALRRSR